MHSCLMDPLRLPGFVVRKGIDNSGTIQISRAKFYELRLRPWQCVSIRPAAGINTENRRCLVTFVEPTTSVADDEAICDALALRALSIADGDFVELLVDRREDADVDDGDKAQCVADEVDLEVVEVFHADLIETPVLSADPTRCSVWFKSTVDHVRERLAGMRIDPSLHSAFVVCSNPPFGPVLLKFRRCTRASDAKSDLDGPLRMTHQTKINLIKPSPDRLRSCTGIVGAGGLDLLEGIPVPALETVVEELLSLVLWRLGSVAEAGEARKKDTNGERGEEAEEDGVSHTSSPLQQLVNAACSAGILVVGSSGVGKTVLLSALSERVRARGHEVHHPRSGAALGSSVAHIVDAMDPLSGGRWQGVNSPVRGPVQGHLVLIDDLEPGPQIVQALIRLFELCLVPSNRLCVVAACSDPRLLPRSLLAQTRFGKVLSLSPPSEMARREIILFYLKRMEQQELLKADAIALEELCSDLARTSAGFMPKDIVRAIRQSKCAAQFNQQPPGGLQPNILRKVFREAEPTQLRGLDVVCPRPEPSESSAEEVRSSRWGGFAGYAEVKRRLEQLLEWQYSREASLKRFNVPSTSGILLYGPSGCGKTMIARQIATFSGLNFVSVKASDLISKYVGESEKAVRVLFARARASMPCVLFFDELDAIAAKRDFADSGGDEGLFGRILATFLNEMDGVDSRKSGVVVVAASSRVDNIDAALTRPGRIDQLIAVDRPNADDREAILRHHCRHMALADDVDLRALSLSEQLTGRTGADLASLCREAAMEVLREEMDGQGDGVRVEQRHFNKLLRHGF